MDGLKIEGPLYVIVCVGEGADHSILTRSNLYKHKIIHKYKSLLENDSHTAFIRMSPVYSSCHHYLKPEVYKSKKHHLSVMQ